MRTVEENLQYLATQWHVVGDESDQTVPIHTAKALYSKLMNVRISFMERKSSDLLVSVFDKFEDMIKHRIAENLLIMETDNKGDVHGSEITYLINRLGYMLYLKVIDESKPFRSNQNYITYADCDDILTSATEWCPKITNDIQKVMVKAVNDFRSKEKSRDKDDNEALDYMYIRTRQKLIKIMSDVSGLTIERAELAKRIVDAYIEIQNVLETDMEY